MSFQAYLDSVKKKTGKSPEDFRALAEARGLLAPGTKAGTVVAWLKADFGLGQGHAMAIYATFKRSEEPERTVDEEIAAHFGGSRGVWQAPCRRLIERAKAFGPGVSVNPGGSYISLLHGTKKFAILQLAVRHLDIGIKLKRTAPSDRLQLAGKWNAMVTHRVRIEDPKDIDADVIGWLRRAYEEV